MVCRKQALTRLAFLAGTMLGGAWAVPALGQSVVVPPVRQTLDANGVDLFTGVMSVKTPGLSVGNGDRTLDYAWLWYGGWVSDQAFISKVGTYVTVSLRGTAQGFRVSGSSFVSTEGSAATLTFDGSTIYTFTDTDGTVVHFSRQRNTSPGYEAMATDITRPDGGSLIVDWTSAQYCIEAYPNEPDTCRRYATAARPAGFRNHANFAVRYTYASDSLEGIPADRVSWNRVTGVAAYNLAVSNSTAIQGMTITPSSDGTYSYFTISDPLSRATRYRSSGAQLLGITLPGSSSEDVTIGYAGSRVSSVTTGGHTTSYAASDAGNERTVVVTDAAAQPTTYVFDITLQRMTSLTDALGRKTQWAYDEKGRMIQQTMPEQNGTRLAYDGRGNVISSVQFAKPNSGVADITTSAAYEPGCGNASTCNQPVSTTDANGNVTNYAYAAHGGVASVTYPPDGNGVRPETRYTYSALTSPATGQAIYDVTGTSTCRTAGPGACGGTGDETRTTIAYDGANLFPVSQTVAAGDGSLSATSSAAYDAVGNVVAVDGPLPGAGDTSVYKYDIARQLVGVLAPDPDGSGPRRIAAMRYSYDDKGQLWLTATGTVADQSDGGFANFAESYHRYSQYDANRRIVRQTLWANGVDYAVYDYLYDTLGRPSCSIAYMDSSRWGPQASACTPFQTNGPQGPDRVVQTSYDAVGRAMKVTTGIGTAAQSDEVRTTYTPNGQVETQTDAMNNRTLTLYDGVDRPSMRQFPGAPQGSNASNGNDHEEYGWDAAGNMVAMRKRDGRLLQYGYDGLNRVTTKVVPDGCAPQQVGPCTPGYATRDVFYAYDLMGHLTSARFDGPSGEGVSAVYDALGRQASTTTTMGGASRTLGYQYDAGGNTTRITHPDGVHFDMSYGTMSEMTNATWTFSGGTVPFMGISYDDLGRRTGIGRASSSTTYAYDAVSRLSGQSQNFARGQGNVTTGFAYNPANQIVSRSTDNDEYAWTGAVNADRTYATNGLNQYTSAGPASFAYDVNGNLVSDGSTSYVYDVENRLVQASGAHGATLVYDPLGRLFETSGGAAGVTRFLYDGSALVGEYDAGGTMLRRYMHGPGTDEPIMWDEGSAMNCSGSRFLHTDERGSVIATADCFGTYNAVNAYDENGIPKPNNTGRFQYTGQAWIPELGLYYYKARMYSPTLARFMQTDPIGYADGMNAYNYAHGDAVNGTDPSGLTAHENPCRTNPRSCTPTIAVGDELIVTGQRLKPSTPFDAQLNTAGLLASTGNSINFVPSGDRALVEREAQQNPQCPVPPSPGPGKATINQNIAEAQRQAADNHNNPAAIDWLANLEDESFEVVDSHSQNYKANPRYRGSAPYGNFNFGATMQARGFSLPSTLGYSNAFQRLTTGRADPPEDVRDVTNGYKYAQNNCR